MDLLETSISFFSGFHKTMGENYENLFLGKDFIRTSTFKEPFTRAQILK